jgi:Mg-chelatase subunit ChlD
MVRLAGGRATAMAVVTAIGLSLAALDPPSYRLAAYSGSGDESSCTSVVSRTLEPSAIRSCEHGDVHLQVRPSCPGDPLNVVLALWAYAHPQATAPYYRAWTMAAVDAMQMSTHPNVKVGIVYVRDNGTILLDLTNDERRVRGASRVPYVYDDSSAHMCLQCAFGMAEGILAGASRNERKVIISIGAVDWLALSPWREDWQQAARTAKKAADLFILACPWSWDPTCKVFFGVPTEWWREATPGYYFEGTNPGAFAAAIKMLVKKTMRSDLTAVSVSDEWPTGVELVPGSVTPLPALVDPMTRRLRWEIGAPITQALTLTYQVRPLAIGTHTFAGGQLVITDSLQQTNVLPLPTGVLTVTGPCEPPTPTPTPPPPPTDTPTATPTAEPPTPTPTRQPATPSPSPTATRAPRPVFLPLVLREHCVPGQKRIDVVLVIDASTSMLERTSSARSKLAAAQAAAAGFLDQLHLAQGDQAAVIAFNDAARVLQGLSGDRRALDLALGRIAVAPTTRLDLAIESAHAELVGRRHRPGNAAVAIVLTDGKANPVGPEVAVAKARLARDAGVTIFTIGLGDDLDDWALAAIASRATYYFRAPDADALAAIYAAIAVEIPCPAEGFWGRR